MNYSGKEWEFPRTGSSMLRVEALYKYTEFQELQRCQMRFTQKCGMTVRNARKKAGNECRGQITKVIVSSDKESFPTWRQWGKSKGLKTGAWHDCQFREIKIVNCKKAEQGDLVGGFCGNSSKRWELRPWQWRWREESHVSISRAELIRLSHWLHMGKEEREKPRKTGTTGQMMVARQDLWEEKLTISPGGRYPVGSLVMGLYYLAEGSGLEIKIWSHQGVDEVSQEGYRLRKE